VFVTLCAFFAVTFAADFNTTSGYDSSQAQRSLWLSAAAYCGKAAYSTHKFGGPTSGFVYSKTISAPAADTEGYIGYLPSDNSIYVVFRGSQSIRNWIANLDAWKTPYTSYPDCNCPVHKGFYQAEQVVIADIISEVKKLQSAHAGYSVKVTGHSLGAALAQLTSMDLTKAGIHNTVYNFGQPRTGDQNYAKFATSKVSTVRVTHNKDTVPHLPYTVGMDFYHVCTEEFENASGSLKQCDSSCEDKTCADQWPFKETNIDDHLVYLGMSVSCAAVSSV
jgi:hypothetical protein